jgi:serine/threonine-protein phosphatase 2B catalytic subunit
MEFAVCRRKKCVPLHPFLLGATDAAVVTEMLLAILSICSKEELVSDTWSDDEEGSDTRSAVQVPLTPSEISQRRTQIKNKILAVGKMQRLFQSLRCVTFSA